MTQFQKHIKEVREHIKTFRTNPELLAKPQKKIQVKPERKSLDLQLLERRQQQLLRKYKKPPGSSDAIEANVLEELEKQNSTRFQTTWKKLPYGLKKNRLNYYIQTLSKKQHWSKIDVIKLEDLMKYKLYNLRQQDIIYDDIKGEIHDLPSLSYSHTSNGVHFKWKTVFKKQKK